MTARICVLGFFALALLSGGVLWTSLDSPEPRIGPRADRAVLTASASGELVYQATAVRKGTRTFSLRATARGLFPGARRPLRLRISNPNRFAIMVTRIGVRVKRDLTHTSCPPRDYVRKTRSTGSVRVRGKSSRRISLDIRLLYRAPDACQGAAFPLRLQGTAVKA